MAGVDTTSSQRDKLDPDDTIVFEDESFDLHQGDTVRILPSRKHKLRNAGEKRVRVLFIKSRNNG